MWFYTFQNIPPVLFGPKFESVLSSVTSSSELQTNHMEYIQQQQQTKSLMCYINTF